MCVMDTIMWFVYYLYGVKDGYYDIISVVLW